MSGRDGREADQLSPKPDASSVAGAEGEQAARVRKLSSRVAYSNRWMTVREDEVEFPGGHRGIYGIVEKPHFALIVPWDGARLRLVRQFRYPIGGAFWEFPQGSAEDGAHSPEQLARRELEEETGLSAGEMTPLGFLYQANGYSNQGFHVFLATRLSAGEPRLEATEAGMESADFSLDRFEALLLAGEIRDGPTVAAYGLLRLKDVLT